MDRHQLRCGSSAVAVTQFNTDDGATPTKRSAAQPAMEAAGNFVLGYSVGFRTVGGDPGVCDGRSAAPGDHSGDLERIHARGGGRTRTGLTLALCSMAFEVSTSNSRTTTHDDNRWPIALAVVASAIAIGVATKGAFDPDGSFDDAVLGIFSWPTLWIYVVSQLLSGIAATITFVSLVEQR